MTESDRRTLEIEKIVLSEEEIKRAIWVAKCQKWNHERNKDYWEDLEKQKPRIDVNKTSEVQKG